MDDYNYGNDYDQDGQQPAQQKTLRGYQIIIIVLALILAVLAFVYVRHMNNLKEDFDAERQRLNEQFELLMGDYDNLQTTNDTINYQLGVERLRADSLIESLAKERTLSLNKIRQYEKELGTLRTVMRGYVVTIDSLNTLNKGLIAENVEYRRTVQTERLAREKAEETATELSSQVRRGSVIRARDINMVMLSRNDREVTRARGADRLRVDFILTGNELAQPGERSVYLRVLGPDGHLLTNDTGAVFQFEGENRTYSAAREVDYQNDDLPVSLYYSGGGIAAGTYTLEVFMDGLLCGSAQILLR